MVVYDNKSFNLIEITEIAKYISTTDVFTGRFKKYCWPLGNNKSKNGLQQGELTNYIKR